LIPSLYQRLTSTVIHSRKTPRSSFAALQHFRKKKTLQSSMNSFKLMSGKLYPAPQTPHPRVWLPSRWRLAFLPLEASFSSQRSWASPFRAFLLLGDRRRVPSPPSTPALVAKTLARLYAPRFSGFAPPKKPSPFLLPEGLIQVGGFCSPGLSDLLRLSLR